MYISVDNIENIHDQQADMNAGKLHFHIDTIKDG